jgi:hypothetical protein
VVWRNRDSPIPTMPAKDLSAVAKVPLKQAASHRCGQRRSTKSALIVDGREKDQKQGA